ncbi:hypothetical protein AVEN_270021-1 [Araneus ventricosus]|uniref:Uncharacterized protein n=1 Tax=Araneus ventricosus TaxID=182803 RepID=A0A4Y2H578_ARAVE|nr:hypothetical protein AVEN_270021-1 [Araneus ventricosus]
MLHAKSYVATKRLPVGVAWKGVPAQVPSSDYGSKLRGPSQNSPRVASKRDANITKLNPNGPRPRVQSSFGLIQWRIWCGAGRTRVLLAITKGLKIEVKNLREPSVCLSVCVFHNSKSLES